MHSYLCNDSQRTCLKSSKVKMVGYFHEFQCGTCYEVLKNHSIITHEVQAYQVITPITVLHKKSVLLQPCPFHLDIYLYLDKTTYRYLTLVGSGNKQTDANPPQGIYLLLDQAIDRQMLIHLKAFTSCWIRQ